jgi:hypothetical protein
VAGGETMIKLPIDELNEPDPQLEAAIKIIVDRIARKVEERLSTKIQTQSEEELKNAVKQSRDLFQEQIDKMAYDIDRQIISEMQYNLKQDREKS